MYRIYWIENKVVDTEKMVVQYEVYRTESFSEQYLEEAKTFINMLKEKHISCCLVGEGV